LALPTNELETRMLIVSDVPLVSWGIRSSLIGLPGIDVTLRPWQTEALTEVSCQSRPQVVIAAPACPRAELCLKLATWRRGPYPSTVVCLAPGGCDRHCRRADITSSLERISPTELRQLLRRAVSRAQARLLVGERQSLFDLHLAATLSAPPLGHVSAREREVGLLVADGYSSGEIAAHLFISQRTVEKHRSNLMAKLGVSNAAALTRELLYLCWAEGTDLSEAHS